MISSMAWPTSLRRRFDAWLRARQPPTDVQHLTHRNVYILPTKAGLLFGLTVATLLVASINYQLNLGYALTFLLAGSALVSMHWTHNTLRGLTLHLRPVKPTFANQRARLEAVLQDASSGGRDRFGVGLRRANAPVESISWTNVAAGGQTTIELSFIPSRRGLHDVPTWTVETLFPLGLFRAWTVWRPLAKVMVYPEAEAYPPPLPKAHSALGSDAAAQHAGQGELEGVRTYRRGDPVKYIVWKKAAQAMASGADLVSRDSQASTPGELSLDWDACQGLTTEGRLSRLTAWVILADQMDLVYGLRLPQRDIAPGVGEAHRHGVLESLALWP